MTACLVRRARPFGINRNLDWEIHSVDIAGAFSELQQTRDRSLRIWEERSQIKMRMIQRFDIDDRFYNIVINWDIIMKCLPTALSTRFKRWHIQQANGVAGSVSCAWGNGNVDATAKLNQICHLYRWSRIKEGHLVGPRMEHKWWLPCILKGINIVVSCRPRNRFGIFTKKLAPSNAIQEGLQRKTKSWSLFRRTFGWRNVWQSSSPLEGTRPIFNWGNGHHSTALRCAVMTSGW